MNPSNRGTRADEGLPVMTMRDILAPVFRHKRLVIGVFSSVSVLAILFAWLIAANYYTATMQIVVQQDRSDPAVTTGPNAAVQTGKQVTPDQITSEVALLQGKDMLRSVAETCGLTEHKYWKPSDLLLPSDPAKRKAARLELAAKDMGKALKVEAEKTSRIIDVKYGAVGAPETPACVLQNLSRLYLEKHLQLLRPTGASQFFTEQTDVYRQELADAEARLVSFSRDAGMAAPDVMRSSMAQQVAMSEAALNQAHQAAAADKHRMAAIQAQLAATPERSSTQQHSMAASELMQTLQATLLAAQTKRTQLLVKYEPSYPLVREVDQEIADTQAAIAKADNMKYVNETTDRDPTYELMREDLAKTRADLASQEATAGALASSLKQMKVQMVDLDAKTVQQAALIRDAKADEANYLLYLGKREQERSSDALNRRSIGDVAVAVPPIVPVLPAFNPLTVMCLGLLGAVVVSIAAGALAEFFDPSFRTPAEVADVLHMPVLASVPRQVA
jgi:succinoglycan biosynthesis transport protein ExoP